MATDSFPFATVLALAYANWRGLLSALAGYMRRRDFIKVIAGAASALPVDAHGQTSPIPLVGYLTGGSLPDSDVIAFRQGLRASGYVDGQNVIVEYRSADGQHDQLPPLALDLVRRQVSVIAA